MIIEAWKRRYNYKKSAIERKIFDRLIKINKPDYIKQDIFEEVVLRTAHKLAHKHMTEIRKGD